MVLDTCCYLGYTQINQKSDTVVNLYVGEL